jgi:hypothetical protein
MNLRGTNTTSCGCGQLAGILDPSLQNTTTHGMTVNFPEEYHIWSKMLARCFNANSSGFEYYGGRGIVVCDRWKNSPEHFLEDMGPRPSPQHSVDRIDVNGPYSPENCRWADPVTQANNRTNNHFLEINGKVMTISQWAREPGANSSCTIHTRLKRGLTNEQAVFRRTIGRKGQKKQLDLKRS